MSGASVLPSVRAVSSAGDVWCLATHTYPGTARFSKIQAAKHSILLTCSVAQREPHPYDKSLRLRSVGVTGTTLDGYAGNPYSWTVNDVNPYQYWAYYIRPYKSGFQLMNMGTKKFLDGYRGVDNSVVHPYQWECNAENTYQYWIFAAEGPKPGYLVRNAATGLCLEASPLGGAVTQKPCDNTNSNQKWWM